MDKIATLKSLIAEARASGRILGLQFVKKTDGKNRVMAIKFGVDRTNGGRPEATAKRKETLCRENGIIVWDTNAQGYRTVLLDRVNKARFDGKTHWF